MFFHVFVHFSSINKVVLCILLIESTQHLTSFLCGSNNVIIGLTPIMVFMKDKGGENFNNINLTRQDPPINNDSTDHEN
jgi:hypothetical protein